MASIGLYLVALISPGYVSAPGSPFTSVADPAGYECLLLGWLYGGLLAVVQPFVLVAWCANIFYFSLIFLALTPPARRIPPWLGVLPFLASLGAFTLRTLPVSIEGGGTFPVVLGSGGWFWLASFALFVPVFWLRSLDP
jgi:hypothetical protein